jgi:hypothetical protein
MPAELLLVAELAQASGIGIGLRGCSFRSTVASVPVRLRVG